MSSHMQHFKHYKILSSLGEGGFGQVFEAWDSKLERSVAIKRLRNEIFLTKSEDLTREARMAASLDHNAFVRIYAVEDDDDTQAIIMELVRGETLKRCLNNKPAEQQALAICYQIADAMQHAHEVGLIHGDLKPSNLIVDTSENVRILDFGLASKTDNQNTSSLLDTNNPQGTIAYMAPERLLGAPASVKTDIYALGIILYELMCGKRPYETLVGLALAAAQVQSSSDAWDYSTTTSEIAWIIRRMTAKNINNRTGSMKDVKNSLARLMQSPNVSTTLLAPETASVNFIFRLAKKLNWAAYKYAGLALIGFTLLLFAAKLLFEYQNFSLEARTLIFSESREFQSGMLALEQWDRPGSIDSAIKHFTNLTDKNPENAAAIAGLSIAYTSYYLGDKHDKIWLQKANASAQQAMKLDSHLALSHVALGRSQFGLNQNELALESINAALDLDPQNEFAWYGKIDCLRSLKKYDEALLLTEEGLQKFPLRRTFADQMGQIYTERNEFVLAEKAFRTSINIQSDSIFAYVNLGFVLTSMGRNDEALHVLQQGLAIRPSAWLYTNIGTVYFAKGDYLKSLDAFEAAVSPVLGNNSDYLSWANLADTLLWIPGRKHEAQQYYRKARELISAQLESNPTDITLASRMALYSARLGDKVQCLTLLEPLLRLSSINANVHFRAGLAFELLGERERALQEIISAHHSGYPLNLIESEPDLEPLRRDPQYSLR